MIDTALLLSAYASGYFPMADPASGEINWYSPDPRTVIPLHEFSVSRSLRQRIRKGTFEVRFDAAFEEVIRSCGRRDETWISEEIVESYCELHRLGYARSVETWREGKLKGGLYGVALGKAFFGESMYSRERDASKVALVALVEWLKQEGYLLLDTQFITPHLRHFGAQEIPREKYLALLRKAIGKPVL